MSVSSHRAICRKKERERGSSSTVLPLSPRELQQQQSVSHAMQSHRHTHAHDLLRHHWPTRRRTCSRLQACSNLSDVASSPSDGSVRVVQAGSLTSAMRSRTQQIRDQQGPCQSCQSTQAKAPLTSQSRREPRSGLSLLARPRPPPSTKLTSCTPSACLDCLHARAPLPAHGLEGARARTPSHINRHAPVRRPRLFLHPFRPLAAQLQPRLL